MGVEQRCPGATAAGADPAAPRGARRYAKRLDSGALAKARLDNTGIASLLYETELKPLTKLALSSQFDATDLSKAPKFGLALGVKN